MVSAGLHKLTIVVLTGAFLLTPGGFQSLAQSIPEHIETLERVNSAVDFDRAFVKMMTDLRAGKLSFQDDDVVRIVAIAKRKPYADRVLPGVYGWAGTMFGNGRMGEAIVYFMESALLYEKQRKMLGQALSYFQIALIQHKAENFDDASEYYHKTLSAGGDSLDHRTRINCFNGLALILREQQNYDQAMIDFRKALAIASAHRDTAWIGILSGNLGSIHLRREHYDSSLHYYFQNLAFIRKTTEVENEIETYVHIGRLYTSKKEYTKARLYIDSATAIIRDRKILFNDFFNPQDYIHESYALLYGAMGDYKRAFEYHRRFHRFAEEKQRRINGRSLKQLQSAYSFTHKQAELDLLKKVNEANLSVIRQQLYTEIAFACIILLLTALVMIAFRTGRQRKKLNQELFHSNAELERLNRVKDKLFSVISHDLRSPLGNLQSMLRLVNDKHIDPEKFAEFSAKLSMQLDASGNALENLLQWAKAQLSEVKTGPENVVLSDLVGNVILQLQEDLDEKTIHCHNALPFHLMARADKNQVEIILRNLVGNAIKFTAAGGQIRISGAQRDGIIEVQVEDNGMGMSEEELNCLFQPDRHFTNPGTNQEKGTGIGLLITREMIANNGGTIRVESVKNKGTTFTFTLPCVPLN